MTSLLPHAKHALEQLRHMLQWGAEQAVVTIWLPACVDAGCDLCVCGGVYLRYCAGGSSWNVVVDALGN